MLLRVLAMAAIAVPSLLLLPSPIQACSCGGPPPAPLDAYEEADAVFLGTVRSVSKPDEELWVEFKAVTVWKGPISSTFKVKTTAPTTCSPGVYGVEIGMAYLVYVTDGYFGLGCDRFNRADAAAADIALFWAGHQVGQNVDYPNGGSGGLVPSDQSSSVPATAFAVIVMVGLLVLGAMGFGLHRARGRAK